jgi:hypothetical protein
MISHSFTPLGQIKKEKIMYARKIGRGQQKSEIKGKI